MSINKEILEYIDASDINSDVKKFLKQGLAIEEKRNLVKKEIKKNSAYFKKYDDAISKIIR